MAQNINGDQAMALGALAAGVSLATSYPGSPGTGTMEFLNAQQGEYPIKVQWCTNERVALEKAIGASLAGYRSLVCVKSVGMNVMVDPMMVLNLTGVHGGLVILLGDDPGAYGSQNDQDTRPIASMVELPLLEPASPAEGFKMIKAAFDLSEKYQTAVIVRETRSFTQSKDVLDLPTFPQKSPSLGLIRDPYRFFPYPKNAVQLHQKLHQKLNKIQSWVEATSFNNYIDRGTICIFASGFVYQKLRDVLGQKEPESLSIYKLGTLFPLPNQKISDILLKSEKVLVLEENEPFVENQLLALAYSVHAEVEILGKGTGHIPREGELYRWQIQRALEMVLPGFHPEKSYPAEDEANERPFRKNRCAQCPYEEILNQLRESAQNTSQKLVIIGDPGCQVKLAGELDAKYAIGSAISVAAGLAEVDAEIKPVAMLGDSAFFHSTIPALCEIGVRQTSVLILVIDNNGAVSTGAQPSPSNFPDQTNHMLNLNIVDIAKACGIGYAQTANLNLEYPTLVPIIQGGLETKGPALVVITVQCQSD